MSIISELKINPTEIEGFYQQFQANPKQIFLEDYLAVIEKVRNFILKDSPRKGCHPQDEPFLSLAPTIYQTFTDYLVTTDNIRVKDLKNLI
jgi:hypothetical protein